MNSFSSVRRPAYTSPCRANLSEIAVGSMQLPPRRSFTPAKTSWPRLALASVDGADGDPVVVLPCPSALLASAPFPLCPSPTPPLPCVMFAFTGVGGEGSPEAATLVLTSDHSPARGYPPPPLSPSLSRLPSSDEEQLSPHSLLPSWVV